ncbi:MAG: hypothetical protein AAF657_28730 [Acidobacteriota bacterium]
MAKYFFKLEMNNTEPLTMSRVKRSGNEWFDAPPDPEDHYCFDLRDTVGFYLNNKGEEVVIKSAQVEFKVLSDGSDRNPFRKDSTTSTFDFGQQDSPGSSFRHQEATQAWFLPGRYGHGIAGNAAPLVQDGTYSKTITIVAAPASDPNNPFPPLVHDPTWVVGDGNPFQP